MALVDTKNTKKLHPAFNGMNDRQIAAIYREDRISMLQPGDILFREGESNDSLYLVIRGELHIKQGKGDVETAITDIVGPGHITADMFTLRDKRSAIASASTPTTLLTIDSTALRATDAEIKSVLFQNLSRQQSLEGNFLLSEKTTLRDMNEHLSKQVQGALNKSSSYAGSSAIQGLLVRVPKLPPYASQLTGLLMSEDVSAKEVAELARRDPSLTSAVLKRVNSAYYSLNQKVTDFQHASLLLGFNQIYQVILGLGIQKTMPNTGQFKRLQTHSILISVLSFEISQATQSGNGPIMNTIGLLHDIGKSVLLLLISQNPKLAFFISLLDRDRVGALLLQNWEIPEAIYQPLEYQKYPESLPPEFIPDECRKKAAILYLAHLCHDYLAGTPEQKIPTTFLADYLKLLGIRETSVEDFVRKALLKCVAKRMPTYPRDVQDFFHNAPGLSPKDTLVFQAEAAA